MLQSSLFRNFGADAEAFGYSLDTANTAIFRYFHAEALRFGLKGLEDRRSLTIRWKNLAVLLGLECDTPDAKPGEKIFVGKGVEGGLEEAACSRGFLATTVSGKKVGHRPHMGDVALTRARKEELAARLLALFQEENAGLHSGNSGFRKANGCKETGGAAAYDDRCMVLNDRHWLIY